MPEALESIPAPTPKYSTRILVWFSGKKTNDTVYSPAFRLGRPFLEKMKGMRY